MAVRSVMMSRVAGGLGVEEPGSAHVARGRRQARGLDLRAGERSSAHVARGRRQAAGRGVRGRRQARGLDFKSRGARTSRVAGGRGLRSRGARTSRVAGGRGLRSRGRTSGQVARSLVGSTRVRTCIIARLKYEDVSYYAAYYGILAYRNYD